MTDPKMPVRWRCPHDQVATFVFRNRPDKSRRETRILDVGCGSGNNAWFLNQEGFAVSAFDRDPEAVEYAKTRCGGGVDLKVSTFPHIPFDGPFDLAFERAALVCVPFEVARETVCNIQKVLVPGGRALFTPYAANGEPTMVTHYTTKAQVLELLSGWKILQLHHVNTDDLMRGEPVITHEFRVWAEKPH